MAKVVKTIKADLPAFQKTAEYGGMKPVSVTERSDAACRERYYGKTGAPKDSKDPKVILSSSPKSW